MYSKLPEPITVSGKVKEINNKAKEFKLTTAEDGEPFCYYGAFRGRSGIARYDGKDILLSGQRHFKPDGTTSYIWVDEIEAEDFATSE